MVDPALQLAATLTLALVFAAAAVSKMRAWDELEGVVRNYRLLPAPVVPLVSGLLPPVELAIALLLLWPATRAAAAAVALVLLAVFGLAIAVNVARGRTQIDCGCFRSALKQNLSWWLVVRNVLLAALAFAALAQLDARSLGAFDYFVAAAGAVALFLAYLSVGYVTLGAPLRFDEIVEARARGAAEAARLSSNWKAL